MGKMQLCHLCTGVLSGSAPKFLLLGRMFWQASRFVALLIVSRGIPAVYDTAAGVSTAKYGHCVPLQDHRYPKGSM